MQRPNAKRPNAQGSEEQIITVESVYEFFLRNLESRALQRQFLDSQLASDSDGEAVLDMEYKQFNKGLLIKRDKGIDGLVLVSLEGRDAKVSTGLVNGFIAMVERQTVGYLVENATLRIALLKRSIAERVKAKQKLAHQLRLDRMLKLEEAIVTAERLGLFEGNDSKSLSRTNEGGSLYLLGVKGLRSELGVLKNRVSDDPYAQGLRDLQAELAVLESIRVEKKDIRTMRLDQAAIQPEVRIKPKRKAIVVLGLIIGLMLGVFSAFFCEFFRVKREGGTVSS